MELIKPNKKYYESYTEAIEEYVANKVSTYSFLDIDSYDIFEYIASSEYGKNLPDGFVPATYLWMVNEDEF